MSQGHIDVTTPALGGAHSEPEVCTVLEVLERLGSKWTIAVLLEASKSPVRFSQLERTIKGVSRRMLTLTLRNLERDGLLTRTVYPTVPPRVEYTPTEMANELYQSLGGLTEWVRRHRGAIEVARAAYDHAHADLATTAAGS